MWQAIEQPFQFDRPSEHGLAARSFGEGVLTAPEAREGVVDSIRDAVLAHFDPADAMGRVIDAGPVAQ
jgi:hypothetical protein